MELPDDALALDRLQRDLPTHILGRTILHYERVGSTNDLARERARAGYPEGLVVLADEQTSGRGRQGRGWAAPPRSSLLMSVLLRPSWMAPADAFALTMLASVALCEATEEVAPVRAGIKWPNDVMLPSAAPDAATPAPLRKAAGILSELELEHNRIAWAVIGIGVNVNWTPTGIVDGRDLAQAATSLSAAAGQPIDRWALLRALLVRLDARYLALRRGQREELFTAWRARLTMLGRPIHVHLLHGELRGIAEGVEPSGALRVRDEQGTLHVILAGDVGG
jgi:BirA family biotin operon repressor/biotin-[acetyl-CoA-carboxylase] ligase